MKNYKELLEEYKFESLIDDEDTELGDGFEGYDEVYTKEIKSVEALCLLVNKKESKIDISWTASGIDFHDSIDDAPADGWAMDGKVCLEFLTLMKEAWEIIKAFNK